MRGGSEEKKKGESGADDGPEGWDGLARTTFTYIPPISGCHIPQGDLWLSEQLHRLQVKSRRKWWRDTAYYHRKCRGNHFGWLKLFVLHNLIVRLLLESLCIRYVCTTEKI
jgi:hypothetical protein